MNNLNAINNIFANNLNTTNKTSANKLNTSQFSMLLNNMINNSTASIGDFSNSSFGNSGSGGDLLGLGSGNTLDSLGLTGNGLGGLGSLTGSQNGSSDNSIIMMLLMLLMQKEGISGSNSTSNNILQNNNSMGNVNTANCNHQFASVNNNTQTQTQTPVQSGNIPSASQVASNPAITNRQGERHAQTYRAVIDQFNVESNERYRINKQGINDTYCNIFTWDVTKAMGAEIPHYVDNQTNAPAYYPDVQNAKEMTANSTNDWLNQYGNNYGWRKVNAQEAQAYANMGMPAITSWKNNSGGHGHLQVVSPSENGAYDPVRGVAIAQAGSSLYNNSYISKVYGDGRLSEVEYFVHI